jgi:hypothetical protein
MQLQTMARIGECPRFVILAPRTEEIPRLSMDVRRDKIQHTRLLSEMQRLRGRIALREGAIAASALDTEGRQSMPGDERSWHLLRLRGDGGVIGCARILVHPRNVKYTGLRIAASSVARCAAWARPVREAVESELRLARLNNLTTIEPGGWVVDENLRSPCDAVSIALGAFAWAKILGNCIGFLTATVKHGSSAILRRLGGRILQTAGRIIPRYFEPAWGCEAELLRFDTNSLNPRFESQLSALRDLLLGSPVFSANAAG